MNFSPDVNHPIHEMLIYQVKLENLLNHLRDELCKTPDIQIIPEMNLTRLCTSFCIMCIMVGKNEINFIEFIKGNQNYREDLITRMVFHSNRIEGSTLTIGETDSILWDSNAKVRTSAREFYAVVNHQKAFEYLLKTIDEELTSEIIIKFGKIFNANVSEIEGFRKTGVVIRGSEDVPPNASQIPSLISELLWQYNANLKENTLDALEREAHFHISFEHIHPFADGNGRTGRILLIRGLLKSNYAPCVINSDNRSEYINFVAKKDTFGLQKIIEEASRIESQKINSLL